MWVLGIQLRVSRFGSEQPHLLNHLTDLGLVSFWRKIYFMPVGMCLWECRYMYVGVGVDVCRDQSTALCACHPQERCLPLLRHSLSQISQIWLDWLNRGPQESSCLCLPALEYITPYLVFLHGFRGVKLRSSCWPGQKCLLTEPYLQPLEIIFMIFVFF